MTVEYRIYRGGVFEDRSGDIGGGLAKLERLRDRHRHAKSLDVPVLLRVELMPDGQPRSTPFTAGGTWGGGCGSTLWLDNPTPDGRELPVFRQSRSVRTAGTQANYEHGRCTTGYRVECEKPRHSWSHQCGFEPFPGVWYSWRPSLLDDAEWIA